MTTPLAQESREAVQLGPRGQLILQKVTLQDWMTQIYLTYRSKYKNEETNKHVSNDRKGKN